MSNVKLKVLVVGATGSIGSLVVKEAVRQGHKVRALVRSESKGRQLPSEAEAVVGDLTRSESLAVAVQGMEAIVFTHGSDGGGKKGAEGVDSLPSEWSGEGGAKRRSAQAKRGRLGCLLRAPEAEPLRKAWFPCWARSA